MKKIWGWIVGAVLVVGIGAYIIWNSSNGAAMTAATLTATNPDDAGSNSTSGMDMANATGSMAGMDMSSTVGVGVNVGTGNGGGTTGAPYKDGTYTGSVANAVYGDLQVAVTISGGKITGITYPVYPNAAGHTSQVSASALPALEQEAIASQSANVNIVSGATQDSTAFQESLAAALAQSQN